jgi:hypothetical protein
MLASQNVIDFTLRGVFLADESRGDHKRQCRLKASGRKAMADLGAPRH